MAQEPPTLLISDRDIEMCWGDTVEVTVEITGEPQFTLLYQINGVVQPIRANTINTIILNITEAGQYIITQYENAFASVTDNPDTIFVTVLPEVPLFFYGDNAICNDQHAIYYTNEIQHDIVWELSGNHNFIEGSNDTSRYIDVYWKESGYDTVSLVYSSEGCSSPEIIKQVEVYERPVVATFADTLICFDQIGALRLAPEVQYNEQIYWPQLDITAKEIYINDMGTYSYIKTDKNGCSDTASIRVSNNCISGFYVPEAFSPNNDGINDELTLFGIYAEFDFVVYSPGGVELFRSRSSDNPWDGTHRGVLLPPGAYYWHVTFTGLDDNYYTKSGVVTIIR